MLRPSIDRLDYSKMLTPPPGYDTVFAVGTTYSLDLDALIGASLALGLSESIDSELKDNPIYLLEALQKTSDKILVFCEGGQIKAPAKSNIIHILLEKMVFEIVLKNKKSFHPKLWIIKYINEEGEALYRCLILSRNLTFDRSWDVAVCINGTVKKSDKIKNINEKSKPLSDFLHAMAKQGKRNEIDTKKKKMLSNLANEILNVSFVLEEKEFTDYSFCPIGIDGYDIENSELFSTYHELFVISPFLSDGTINELNKMALKNSIANTLITRKSELPKLKPISANNFNIYALKDIIIDGEEAISEGDKDYDNEEKQKQDIHAKLYLKTKYSDSFLYLGSLNATNSACYGNVEFMLKLYGKKRYLNVEMLKKDLFGENEKDNPFERVELNSTVVLEKSVSDNLERIIKEISRLESYARVIECDEKYAVEVRFEKLYDIDNVYISPLLSNKEKLLVDSNMFEDLKILQISEFYIIRAVSGDDNVRRVIKIRTENIPESRESLLVNSIIKDKNGFIQYITFLLGEDYLLSMLENSNIAKYSFIFSDRDPIPALYEKMLKAAAHSPKKFEEIKKLLELISDDRIIPNGFKELYNVFDKVVSKKCK